MRIRRWYNLIVLAMTVMAAFLPCQTFAATYVSQAVAVSADLLAGTSASGIANFHYNLASLPAGSSARIQFSKNNTNWYSAGGVLGEWTTISAIGGADLDLTAFAAAASWASGDSFYYKLELNATPDLTQTPAVEDIRLDYTPAAGYEKTFIFDDYGNVGIGTAAPWYTLDVNGTINSDFYRVGGVAALGTTGGKVYVGSAADYDFGIYAGAADRLFIQNSTGNVGIGTASPSSLLHLNGALGALSGGLAFGDGDTGLYENYDDNFRLQTAGVDRITIDATGNVGIGTTVPSGLLHVAGGQCVTGDTRLRVKRRRKRQNERGEWIEEEYFEDCRIDQIKAGDEILTLDENTGRLVVSRVKALMDMGVKEIYRLTTATGKTIRTTANHPYLARKSKTARTYAFIDASNIIYGCRQSGWRMDFKKLYSYLKVRFNAARIIYYAGEDVANARQQAFYNLLRQWGYELVIKPVKTFTGESGKITKKANVDVDLTFEAMLYFGEYDRAVFFTGDGDFYRLIAHCEVNKQRVWLFGNAKRTARELKTLLGYRFSDLDDLQQKFEFIKQNETDPTIVSARCIMSSSYQAPNCVSRGNDGQATKNPAFDGATSTPSMYLNEAPLVKGEMKKEKAPAKAEVALLPLLCGKRSSMSSDDGGRWTKVADICEGMEIATADENSGQAVWERIAKIEKLPAEQVYDIEVEGTHNFVGNGIVAHNTYLQGADQLNTSFALRVQDSAAADKFVVTNAGNVGIGTTSPSYTLDVNGGFRAGNATSTNALVFDPNTGNVGVGTAAPTHLLSVADDGIYSAYFSGRVGIGTTSPGAKLDVVQVNSSVAKFGNVGASGSGAGAGMIGYSDDGAAMANGDRLGYLMFGGAYDAAHSIRNSSGITSFVTEDWSSGASGADLRFETVTNGSTSRTAKMVIDNLGNVGIGTTSPAELLDVNGRVRLAQTTAPETTTDRLYNVSGNLLWNGIDLTSGGALPVGTEGQMLYNNAGAWTAFNGLYWDDTNSRLGIGTTTPSQALDVAGAIAVSGKRVAFRSSGITYLGGGDSGDTETRIRVYGSDKMTLLSSGNVGIGTTTPTQKLEVNGSLVMTGDRGDIAKTGLYLYDSGATSMIAGYTNTGGVRPVMMKGNYLGFYTGSSVYAENMRIDSSGNVGIGTAAPWAKLDVVGDVFRLANVTDDSTVKIGRFLARPWNNANANWSMISSWSTNTTNEVWIGGNDGAYNASTDIKFFTTANNNTLTGSERMRINNAGNVGIGTTSPAYTLDVNGGFRAGNATSTNALVFDPNTGNVGIGTASPGQALSVSGDQTVSGYLRVGSNTAPAANQPGDLTANYLALGTDAASGFYGRTLYSSYTNTDTAAGAFVMAGFNNVIAPPSNSSSEYRAINFQNILNAASGITYNIVRGGYFENRVRGDGLVAELNAVRGVGMVLDSASAATGQATNVYGFNSTVYARPSGTSTATIGLGVGYDTASLAPNYGLTINTLTGFRMYDPVANAITNLIGLDITDLTRGTNNYGIRSAVSSGANKYNLYLSGTANNYIAGNVGIGTTAPGATLHVAASSTIATIAIDDLSNSHTPNLSFKQGGVEKASIAGGRALGNNLDFITGGSVRMSVDSSGNVGIGTTTPNAQTNQTSLSINGTNASRVDLYVSGTRLANLFTTTNITTLGTVTATPLAFRTNDLEALRIDSSGNVGIGTTDPAEALDVNGRVRLAQTTAPETTADRLYNVSGNLLWNGVNLTAAGALPVGTEGQMLYNNAGAWTAFNGLYWDDTNSRLGIGTTAPIYKLNVAAANASTDVGDASLLGIVNTDTTANNTIGLAFGQANLSGAVQTVAGIDLVGVSHADGAQSGALAFATRNAGSWSEKLRISEAGNVGIGTTSPGYKLTVQSEASETTLGNSLLTNGDFADGFTGWTAGANWSAATGAAAHTTGAAEAISQNITVTTGQYYQIDFGETGDTAGSLTFAIGSESVARAYWESASVTIKTSGATGTQTFSITPSSDYNGTIDNITVRLVTPASTPAFTLLNADGTAGGVQIKAGGSGRNNIFIGSGSGRQNTTGNNNNALGANSLFSNTTGYGNNALGISSLRSNTTGNYNNALGASSLFSNTTGNYNNALGANSLFSNTTGYYNNALGYYSLRSNTTGYDNNALGREAGYYNQTGIENNYFGDRAGGFGAGSANSHSGTTAVGSYALYNLTTGNYNLGLGYKAGENLTSGSGNIIIGYDIDAPSATASNQLNIGNLIFGTGVDGRNATLSSGNVGIGATSPTGKLTVRGDSSGAAADLLRLENLGTAAVNSGAGLQFIMNRTTGGATEFGRLDMLATSIDNTAYSGALQFKIAANGLLETVAEFGSANIVLNRPLQVNVAGDTGISYDLQFMNTGVSNIVSNGPLTISAGTIYRADNLTLTTRANEQTGDFGTAATTTATTLTDSGKAWTADEWIGGTITIVAGAGKGQTQTITDNDATVITVADWDAALGDPSANSVYRLSYAPAGDVLANIANANAIFGGFKVLGNDNGGYAFRVAPDGNVYVGGEGAGESSLFVKQNITAYGGILSLRQLNISEAGTPTATSATSGGSCADSTAYYYKVTAVNGNGETTGTAQFTVTTGASGSGINLNTIAWSAVTGATGYKIYRSTENNDWDGDANDQWVDGKVVAAPAITYDDNCAGDTASLTPPTANTTGGKLAINTAGVSPTRRFEVLENTGAAPQMKIISDSSNYSEFYVDATGDLSLKLTGSGGDDLIVLDENLKICAGGDFGAVSCPTAGFSLSGTGNLIVENKVIADKFEQICPTGYVWVPGSAKHGTLPGFCVMKYEAKNVGSVPTSQAADAPWASVTQENARAYCQALGEGYHLVSEAEWMTIAENIAATPINDIDAGAGLQLATGHTDNDPANSLAAGTDPAVSACNLRLPLSDAANAFAANCQLRDSGAVYGYSGTGNQWSDTGYSAGGDNKSQLRVHALSNGNTVWDIAGNVWEWTDAIISQVDQPGIGNDGGAGVGNWGEWNVAYYLTGAAANSRPPDDGWTATNGIGRLYTYGRDETATTTYRAFLRGGYWSYTSYAGVFALYLSYSPADSYSNVGFRCAR